MLYRLYVSCLFLTLACVSVVFAANGTRMGVKDILPIVTAILGAAGSMVMLFPTVRKVHSSFDTLVQSMLAWWKKYGTSDSQMVQDFREIIRSLDTFTDDVASLLRLFGLHKVAKVLQDLIQIQLYTGKNSR